MNHFQKSNYYLHHITNKWINFNILSNMEYHIIYMIHFQGSNDWLHHIISNYQNHYIIGSWRYYIIYSIICNKKTCDKNVQGYISEENFR